MSNFNLMPFVLTVRTKPLSTYERCGEWCAFCMVKLLGWARKFLERAGTYLFLDLAFTRRGLSLFSLVFPPLLPKPKSSIRSKIERRRRTTLWVCYQLFHSVFSFYLVILSTRFFWYSPITRSTEFVPYVWVSHFLMTLFLWFKSHSI